MNQKTKQEKIDRLAKAREARYKKNPPAYKQFAASVVAKPDDDEFSLKNVREWIKEAKSLKQSEHRNHVAGVQGALANRVTWESYIGQMESYLRTGDWCSKFAGPRMEKRVKSICVAMAYYPNGKPKREMGVWYPDVRDMWTPELENEERLAYGMKELHYTDSGSILVERSTRTKKKATTTKKKRKPMTAAQKKAFVARMKKAREAKMG